MAKRKASAGVIGARPVAPVLPSDFGPGFDAGAGAGAGSTSDETDLSTSAAAPSSSAPPTPSASLTMYTPEGAPVDVDPASAPELFRSQKLGFAEGQKIQLKDRTGRVFEAAPDQALSALEGGFGVASAEDVAAAKERKEYNTIGKTAKAFAAGAGRGLTFGLSDVAATGIGGEATRSELAKLKEHHPIASTTGEVVGALAPIVASGGLGAGVEGAAEGAGLASRTIGAAGIFPRAVAGIGSAVERGAAHIVGEGATSLLGRVAQRAIPLAAQGAAEGAFYGVGGEVSEAALGDHELTAEKLLAGAKRGAILGGIGGAVLGGGEILGKAAADRVFKFGGEQGLQSWLESFSNQRTVKALGASQRDISRLGRTGEEANARINEIGKTIRDYRFEDGKKLFSASSTVKDLAEKTERALDEQTSKLERVRREISKTIEAKPELSPDASGFMAKVDQDIIAPLKESNIASVQARAGKVERELATLREKVTPPGLSPNHPLFDVAENAAAGNEHAARVLELAKTKDPGLRTLLEPKPVTIDELTQMRKDLDSVIFPKTNSGVPPPAPEHQAELLQMRKMLEGTIEEASERAAKESGKPALYQELVDAKRQIHDLIPAKQMAERWLTRDVGNRMLSPTDYGAGGSVLAGMLAGGHGGPVAALAGGATAFAHNVLRERGSALAAAAADKLSQLSRIRTASLAVDQRIEHGITSALGTAEGHEAEEVVEKAHDAARHVGKAAYERHEERLEELSAPKAHMERLASMVTPIATHAPQTAAMVAQKAQQAVANLDGQMPKHGQRQGSLQPALDPPRIPESAKAKFARYAEGVHDPLSVLSDVKDGRLSREKVQAVRENYPKLYEEMKQKIVERLATMGKAVPYEKRVQLGLLFRAPTDPTLEPAFIQSMRQLYSSPASEQQGASAGAVHGARRPMKIAANLRTPIQEVMAPGQ